MTPPNVKRIGETCPYDGAKITMRDGRSTVCSGPMRHHFVNPDAPRQEGRDKRPEADR